MSAKMATMSTTAMVIITMTKDDGGDGDGVTAGDVGDNNDKMISVGSGVVAASWMVMMMIGDDDGRDQVTIFRGCWHPGFHPTVP